MRKQPHTIHKEWAWVSSNENLFIKTGKWMDLGHYTQLANSRARLFFVWFTDSLEEGGSRRASQVVVSDISGMGI